MTCSTPYFGVFGAAGEREQEARRTPSGESQVNAPHLVHRFILEASWHGLPARGSR